MTPSARNSSTRWRETPRGTGPLLRDFLAVERPPEEAQALAKFLTPQRTRLSPTNQVPLRRGRTQIRIGPCLDCGRSVQMAQRDLIARAETALHRGQTSIHV